VWPLPVGIAVLGGVTVFIAPWILDDPIKRDAFETCVTKVLIPELLRVENMGTEIGQWRRMQEIRPKVVEKTVSRPARSHTVGRKVPENGPGFKVPQQFAENRRLDVGADRLRPNGLGSGTPY
jgi:hypothetical protein